MKLLTDDRRLVRAMPKGREVFNAPIMFRDPPMKGDQDVPAGNDDPKEPDKWRQQ